MSRAGLQKCKRNALRRLTPALVMSMFRPVLSYVCEDSIYFDLSDARRRIRDAVLLGHTESHERQHEISGETDGDTIWLVRGMGQCHTTNTLLHEALHDSVFVLRNTRRGNKRALTCECEHRAMRLTGL